MDSHAGANSGPRTVKHAVLVPLIVLSAMVLFIGLIATLLLFNTHLGSLALATVVAAGILLAVSLLASQGRIGRGRGSVPAAYVRQKGSIMTELEIVGDRR
jgi:hypothetical protein